MAWNDDVRRHFPFLQRRAGISYLDTAATAQMPEPAIAAMADAARRGLGNPHRGLHPLADDATRMLEEARTSVASFIGAAARDVVFTKNATEGFNLAARSLGERWGENDAVAVTRLEHHANVLPWLQLGMSRGVGIRWIDVDPDGTPDRGSLDAALRDERVRLLAITGQSNVLGTRPDLSDILPRAKKRGILTCVDATQLAAHAPVDVRKLGCDILALSGHKTYGPTGIGALYCDRDLLATMPPFLTGGGMVREVHDDGFSPADGTARFEAGTPPLLSAIGWAAAIEWQKQWTWDDRIAHETAMTGMLLHELRSVPGVTLLGPGKRVSGCVSFTVDGAHPHDVADLLGQSGVCVRAGHHCAQPLHAAIGIEASVRASVGIYTDERDVRALAPAIRNARTILLR